MTNTQNSAGTADGRAYHADGTVPDAGAIWVFGSNLAGRHGKGAALVARQTFGARYGVGAGATGRAYAIPTKNGRDGASLRDPAAVLPMEVIAEHVRRFIEYAEANPGLRFTVTRVGCGESGFSDKEMAPLFAAAPSNCTFAHAWREYLEPSGRPTPARARPR